MNTTQGVFRPRDYKRYMTLDGLCAILYLELLLWLRSTQIVKTALRAELWCWHKPPRQSIYRCTATHAHQGCEL